jgi:DNA-binding GntR family transcriptional regulator
MNRQQEVDVPTDKEWYELAELASEWQVPIVRVRSAVSNLESVGIIQVRDRPGDKRYKQVNKASLDTLRKAVLGA